MPYPELSLNSQLCVRIYTVSRLLTQSYRPFLEKINLTYPQYIVMMLLWEKDCVPVGYISERLLLETNTLTPLLKRMEKEGLITRKRNSEDTRQKIIALTPKGKLLEEKAVDVPHCMADVLKENNIPSEDLLTMLPVLDNMINKLKTKKH